jgi:5'-nucleotidase
VESAVADQRATVLADQQVALEATKPQLRTGESNAGDLVADALLWQADQLNESFGAPQPDVAIANGGGIRGNREYAVGDFTEFNSFELLPFPNFVTIIESLRPEQLRAVLENAVSNVENVDGRFAQIAGFSFEWSRSNAPGSRVLEVTLADGTSIVSDGTVVSGAPTVNVATVDFLATGGDGYDWGGAPFTKLGTTYRAALENFVTDPAQLNGVISDSDYPRGGLGRIKEQ